GAPFAVSGQEAPQEDAEEEAQEAAQEDSLAAAAAGPLVLGRSRGPADRLLLRLRARRRVRRWLPWGDRPDRARRTGHRSHARDPGDERFLRRGAPGGGGRLHAEGR